MLQDEENMTSKKRRHDKGPTDDFYATSLPEAHNGFHADVKSNQISSSFTPVAAVFKDRKHQLKCQQNNGSEDQLNNIDLKNGDPLTFDNKNLLHVIEAADLERAVELLKTATILTQSDLDNALISACYQRLKFLVQKFVGLGAHVNFKDMNGNSPLLICAKNGSIDIVKFLLQKNADVNICNSAGDTALILSMQVSGSSHMVAVLLTQKEIDITHQNKDGCSALMKAIEVKDVETIKLLLDTYHERAITFDTAVNCNGETAQQIAEKCGLGNLIQILNKRETFPLLVAIEASDIESFIILMDCHLLDDFGMEKTINTFLTTILSNCQKKSKKNIDNEIKMVRKLLVSDACKYIDWSNEFLVSAVRIGSYELIELMCQHLDLKTQFPKLLYCDTKALSAAAEIGRCDLIELLLQHKAAINDKIYFGSPLDCALRAKHFDCAQILFQSGAAMSIGEALYSANEFQVPEYMHFLFDNYKQDVMNYALSNANNFNELLFDAAKQEDNLEIINLLIDAGADVNCVYDSEDTSYTPLAVADNIDVARLLISRGAKVNDIRCEYPLLHLVPKTDSPNIDIFNLLLDSGSSVKQTDRWDRTPLIMAASEVEDVAILKTLLDHGADFNSYDEYGNTALISAAFKGCLENVSFLLQFAKEKGYSIDKCDKSGFSVLMHAAKLGHIEIAQQLIDHGVDVNIRDQKGNTALLLALVSGPCSQELLTTLITAGSDVNSQNNEGLSPLMYAAKSTDCHSITKLLDSGADVNAYSKKDNTKTAVNCIKVRYFDSVEIFCLRSMLEKGADSSYIEPSLLHKLIIHHKIDIIPMLIKNGSAPINVETDLLSDSISSIELQSVSPLIVALMTGNVSLAKYFVRNMFLTKSDVSILTRDMALRDYLMRRKRIECLSYFDELSSQPMSLFQLAFVSVSSALGPPARRVNRVNMLPIPDVFKNKLLFRSADVTLDIPKESSQRVIRNTDMLRHIRKVILYGSSDEDNSDNESDAFELKDFDVQESDEDDWTDYGLSENDVDDDIDDDYNDDDNDEDINNSGMVENDEDEFSD